MTDLGRSRLRPYQIEVGTAILDSVNSKKGLTFSVEMARQGGKNELSAYLELGLLAVFMDENKNLIKCSPTFKPQTVVSMTRLKEKLNEAGYGGIWTSEMGYIIRLGDCRAIFLSAENSANVVGNTAHLLLEVDEAQDVSEEKYTKEFKPMGSTTNVTSVLYGTTWDDSTLLEKVKQTNLELERKDGIKRHFRYDCHKIGQYNQDYMIHVEREEATLGKEHPLYRTQYLLLPIHGGGRFLSALQRAQLQGEHQRRHGRETGRTYVAGIDLAGEAETGEDDYLKALKPKQDSTVVTIGEVVFEDWQPEKQIVREKSGVRVSSLVTPPQTLVIPSSTLVQPVQGEIQSLSRSWQTPLPGETVSLVAALSTRTASIKIVEHYAWKGRKHTDLYPQLVDLLKNVWHCRRIVVDATGIGEPVASFLQQALGSRVVPFKFSVQSKSELGFNLLAAVNSGNLKMYGGDNSAEYQEFWFEMEKAKQNYRPNQTMNFYVDPTEGHDDYLLSLALLVEATNEYSPREARGT